MFGSNSGADTSGDFPSMNRSSSQVQTPYLNINPQYLTAAEEYILPEDAAATRSRAQTMFTMIGTAAVSGALIGGVESLRYSGLQWLKGKSQRMLMTSAVLKNGGQMAQKFGSVAVLYCACSIICEKTRGVDDEINTIVGGAAAGALYSLPGVFNVQNHGPQAAMEEETIGFLKKTIRRLPPVGRFFFGVGTGVALSGLLCLYRTSGPDFVREITKRT